MTARNASPPQVGAPGPIAAGQAQMELKSKQADSAKGDAQRKRSADVRALAALQAIELICLDCGDYLPCKWSLSRQLSDEDVEPWLARQRGDK